jgi:hypothetical protein
MSFLFSREYTTRAAGFTSGNGATYARDPLSPPFHVNLVRGLRFVQVSLLVRAAQLWCVSLEATIAHSSSRAARLPGRPSKALSSTLCWMFYQCFCLRFLRSYEHSV